MKRTTRHLNRILNSCVQAMAWMVVLTVPIQAVELYWDEDGTTAGFGTASGTWTSPTPGPTIGWSTDSAGTATITSLTTTTSDRLYFGTAASGLGSGTVTVSGAVNAGDLFFGNASGPLTLSGGSIGFGAGGTSNIRLETTATPIGAHTLDSDMSKASGTIQFGNQATNNEKYIVNGILSGGFSLDVRVRNNTGVLSLNGLNTFSGNVGHVTGQVNANTLNDGGVASSLGAGSFHTMGGGGGQSPLLWYTGAAATSTDRTFRSTANGAARLVAQAGAVDFTGILESGNGNVNNFHFSGTADTGVNTVSGVIQNGSGGIKVSLLNTAPVDGSGEAAYWKFSGDNSYTGSTFLNSGTLEAAHANALGVGGNIDFGGGTLKYGTGITTDWSARIVNSASAIKVDTGVEDVTWATALANSNTGGLTKEGAGTLRVTADWSTYSGDTTVNDGTFQVRNTADLVGFSSANFGINNGSTLDFQSTVGGSNRMVLNNKVFTFDSNGGGTVNLNNGNFLFQGSGSTHTFTTSGGLKNTISSSNGGFMNMQGYGVITLNVADGSDDWDLELAAGFSNGRITKNGAGTLAITTSTGTTGGSSELTINDGTLEVGGSGRLGGGSFSDDIANDGIFKYSSTQDQTLSGTITGSGSLVKTGGATLRLSGANSYSGTTAIQGGLILFNGDGAAANGDLTVSAGAVGGSGTIGGLTTIENGGALSPGDAGVGTLTLSGALDISAAVEAATASMWFDLGPALTGDQISMNSGTLTIGTAQLDLDDFAFMDLGVSEGNYVLFDANSISGTLGATTTKNLFGGTQQASLSIDGANNNIVLGITAIPEPGNLALFLLGASVLIGGIRSRRTHG